MKMNRIIDADTVLKKAGFKMSSKKVLAMQGELLEGEKIAKIRSQLPKMPDSIEMERRASQFRADELRKVR